MCSRVAFLLFLRFCKNFFQTVVIDFILLRMQASKQTNEETLRTNERTNERNASKCNFLAKRPFHCFHSCFYLCCASSQDIEPFLLLSFAHFLFLSVFLSVFCLDCSLKAKVLSLSGVMFGTFASSDQNKFHFYFWKIAKLKPKTRINRDNFFKSK